MPKTVHFWNPLCANLYSSKLASRLLWHKRSKILIFLCINYEFTCSKYWWNSFQITNENGNRRLMWVLFVPVKSHTNFHLFNRKTILKILNFVNFIISESCLSFLEISSTLTGKMSTVRFENCKFRFIA